VIATLLFPSYSIHLFAIRQAQIRIKSGELKPRAVKMVEMPAETFYPFLPPMAEISFHVNRGHGFSYPILFSRHDVPHEGLTGNTDCRGFVRDESRGLNK